MRRFVFFAVIGTALGGSPIFSSSNDPTRTPCCLDRLTTLSCIRLKAANAKQFEHKCATSADFAMVQCCRTCFDADSNGEALYKETTAKLLMNPVSTQCFDRRAEQWCKNLVLRKGMWTTNMYQNLGCSQVPFAFRVCRKACGYCSATSFQQSGVVYDYKIATDPSRCDTPKKFFATEPVVGPDFDPLENIGLKAKSPTDYFVVTDHNYIDYVQ